MADPEPPADDVATDAPGAATPTSADPGAATPASADPGAATPASADPGAATPASAAARPPKLEVRDLSVTYQGKGGEAIEAVRDVSFTVQDKPGCGEIVVFLGPSGCGKSTVLKAVAGLIEPTKGEVLVDGKPVSGTSRQRGMVFQAYTSFAWLTVQGNVEYGLRLKGVPRAERRAQATEYLAAVGLKDFARQYPKSLSGGMKQRVAIARTLVNKPRLLLMDEPFGALDPHTRWEMQGLILDISRKEDNTILFVTHDVAEAVYLADTVYVLSPRPAQVVETVRVPFFEKRDQSLRWSTKFRELERALLDRLTQDRGVVGTKVG
jgi:NitT/TauT family transport system ATP-binding protein